MVTVRADLPSDQLGKIAREGRQLVELRRFDEYRVKAL
jgi:hypothetical protein